MSTLSTSCFEPSQITCVLAGFRRSRFMLNHSAMSAIHWDSRVVADDTPSTGTLTYTWQSSAYRCTWQPWLMTILLDVLCSACPRSCLFFFFVPWDSSCDSTFFKFQSGWPHQDRASCAFIYSTLASNTALQQCDMLPVIGCHTSRTCKQTNK